MSQKSSDSPRLRHQGGAVGESKTTNQPLQADTDVPRPSTSQGNTSSVNQALASDNDSLYNFAIDFLAKTNPDGEISVSMSKNTRSDDTSDESTGVKETSFTHSGNAENGKLDNYSLDEGGEIREPSTCSTFTHDTDVVDPGVPEAPENHAPENGNHQDIPVDNGDGVMVQIEDDEQQQVALLVTAEEPVGPLESYLHLMNNLGLSLYRRDEYVPLRKNVACAVKITFSILTVCAFLETFRKIKWEGIEVAVHRTLQGCVKFGFVFLRLFNRGFFVYLITFCAGKLSEMLLYLRNIQKKYNIFHDERKHSRMAVTLGLGTIFLATITVIFSFSSFTDWSFEKALLRRAYLMAKSLFLWTIEYYDEVDEALYDKYTAYVSIKTLALGVSKGFLEFCATLQGEIIRDILLLAPLNLWFGWDSFDQRIQTQLRIHPNNVDPAELEATVRQYKDMRQANTAVNSTLDTLHNYVSIQNLLLYTYLFIVIITFKRFDMGFILIIVKVIKVSVGYFVSSKLYGKNGNAKRWLSLLTTYRGPVDVEGILGMTVQAALQDLRDDPIGFGLEYFLINKTFLFGFAAAASSIIAFLVETEPERNYPEEIAFSCLPSGGGAMNCPMILG